MPAGWEGFSADCLQILSYSCAGGAAVGYVIRMDRYLPEIAVICRRHGVRELLLFGSALSAIPGFLPASVNDIDFLVDFLPGKRIGLFELSAMRMELEALLGLPVDLVPKSGLKPLIRNEVLSRTETVYAA